MILLGFQDFNEQHWQAISLWVQILPALDQEIHKESRYSLKSHSQDKKVSTKSFNLFFLQFDP